MCKEYCVFYKVEKNNRYVEYFLEHYETCSSVNDSFNGNTYVIVRGTLSNF